MVLKDIHALVWFKKYPRFCLERYLRFGLVLEDILDLWFGLGRYPRLGWKDILGLVWFVKILYVWFGKKS